MSENSGESKYGDMWPDGSSGRGVEEGNQGESHSLM